jgi:hypothetical protein
MLMVGEWTLQTAVRQSNTKLSTELLRLMNQWKTISYSLVDFSIRQRDSVSHVGDNYPY